MKILVVNPNTTASMTAKIAATARTAAAPGTEIVAVNPGAGPASIEGFYDEALSLPGLLEEIAKGEELGVDGHVIACFDDSGLEAARALARAPVVALCEASVHTASLIAGSFTIVTTLGRSVPAIESLVRRYGMAGRCRRVRASEVPVLALEDPASDARRRICDEIGRAVAEDRAEAIVLGCAGMADLARELTAQFGLPVIDGVAAAVKLVEGLAALGLRTSKVGGYAAPLAKAYAGHLARFAPPGDLHD